MSQIRIYLQPYVSMSRLFERCGPSREHSKDLGVNRGSKLTMSVDPLSTVVSRGTRCEIWYGSPGFSNTKMGGETFGKGINSPGKLFLPLCTVVTCLRKTKHTPERHAIWIPFTFVLKKNVTVWYAFCLIWLCLCLTWDVSQNVCTFVSSEIV